MSRPDARTVMLGLMFWDPDAESVVALWFPLVDLSGVRPTDRVRVAVGAMLGGPASSLVLRRRYSVVLVELMYASLIG